MQILQNISLRPYNTFRVEESADFFVSVESLDALKEALSFAKEKNIPVIALGGGSNILPVKRVPALVIKMSMKGIHFHEQSDEDITLRVAAGEEFNDVIEWAVSHGYGGIENLSLIPGSAGAAAVQNIGAYGVEFKDSCSDVTALHMQTGEMHVFQADECEFGYRNSFFKKQREWIVVAISLHLSKKVPRKISYGSLQKEFEALYGTSPCYGDIAHYIASIRLKKLPDVKELGSAGSFFMNPVVTRAVADGLKRHFADIPTYPVDSSDGTDLVKLSAAWLIDKAGWKGERKNDVGTYPFQPLVIVNYGSATGPEILRFSEQIQKDVQEKFGVTLTREVVVLPL